MTSLSRYLEEAAFSISIFSSVIIFLGLFSTIMVIEDFKKHVSIPRIMLIRLKIIRELLRMRH